MYIIELHVIAIHFPAFLKIYNKFECSCPPVSKIETKLTVNTGPVMFMEEIYYT